MVYLLAIPCFSGESLYVGNPRPGVVLRISQRQLNLEFPSASGQFVPFFNSGFIALRKTVDVEPRSVIKTNRVDDKGVAFPAADGHSIPRRPKITEVGARGDFSPVHPDLT